MIKVLIEKTKKNEPIFKIRVNDKEIEKYRMLRAPLFQSVKIKGEYNYKVPIRFFEPIINNIPSEDIEIDKKSINSYLEFSDEYDEKYYYTTEPNAAYMSKWRLEGCPTIFKVSIDIEKSIISKEIAFKKVEINI